MKQWTPLVLFLLLYNASAAANDTDIPEPADLHLVEETLLLTAVEAAQTSVRTAPTDPETWGYLGHVYLIHGWEDAALPCYRQANVLAPSEFRWLYFLGRLLKQQQPAESVVHLTHAVSLDPDYAPAHLYLAAALRTLGRFSEAEEHLRRARHLQPKNPFSELWLGEIALAKQELPLARTHLARALQLNPEQSEAHALMAQIAMASGDLSAAKHHAQAARLPSQYGELRDPLWWDVLKAGATAPLYAERGRRYMAQGDYAKAAAEFEPLISGNQKDVEIWLDYGIALLHIKRYSDAIAALESAKARLRIDTERKPQETAYLNAQVYYYIGQTYYETGDPDAAIQACQQALQMSEPLIGTADPRSLALFSNVHANLALLYEETDRLESAIEAYQKALELLPTKPSLHRDIAGVYWKQQRYTAAEPHYKTVVEDDPENVKAIYRLGLIALTNGQHTAAISKFDKVIALDPEHVRAYGGLGLAYQRLGNFSAAKGAFEKVLQLDPGNRGAAQMLTELQKRK